MLKLDSFLHVHASFILRFGGLALGFLPFAPAEWRLLRCLPLCLFDFLHQLLDSFLKFLRLLLVLVLSVLEQFILAGKPLVQVIQLLLHLFHITKSAQLLSGQCLHLFVLVLVNEL